MTTIFIPKLDSLNEFMNEMKSYNFELKTKNLRLNLRTQPKKIYNINLATNFKPKINKKCNKIKNCFSSSAFSFSHSKKEKTKNRIKYNYNNIYIYNYKKKTNINNQLKK